MIFNKNKIFIQKSYRQNPNVRANMEKAIMGINQQKKTIIKHKLTSSTSIFFISPYLTIKIYPNAEIPTTTIDQPIINHLKKSDNQTPKKGKATFYFNQLPKYY